MKKLLALLLLFGIVGCSTTSENSYVLKGEKTYKKSHNVIPTPIGKWELASSYGDLLYPKVQATNIDTGMNVFMNSSSGYYLECPIFSTVCLSKDPNDNGGSSWGLFDEETVSIREIFVIDDEKTEKVNSKIRQFTNMKRAQQIVVEICEQIHGSECYVSMINDKEEDFYRKKQEEYRVAYDKQGGSSSIEYNICEGMYEEHAGKGFLTYWDNCWGTAYINGNEVSSIFKKNKASDYAEIIFADKSTYKGAVNNNQITGYGVITDINGNTYKGGMLNGEMNGKGLCKVNKRQYECNFDRDEYLPPSRSKAKTSYKDTRNKENTKVIRTQQLKKPSTNNENRFASLLGDILIGAISEVVKQKIIDEFVEPCVPKVMTSSKSSQYIPGAPQYGTKVRTKVTITGCPQQYPFK